MKNSKWMRFLLIVVSVAMVLSLFACGDKRGNEGETTTAAPEGTTAAPENTTVAGGETTTVAGGETTTVAGGETTTVAGGETTVAGGEDTTVAGGEDTTVAGGEDTTVAGGEDTTVAGGEDTTVAPDDVYAGNWHASIDVFLADVDGNLGDNVLAGDFSAVDTVIANANTNNHRGTTIIDVANVEYPSVNASCVFFGVGWIAVDGYDVENFVCNVYDADGNVLKTVALGLTDAEIGVVEHVSNNMNYAAGTVAHRLTVNLEAELIDLSDYDGQTVKVVYSIDVATTEYTIDLIEIEVVVPEAPAGEDTTVDGGEDTTVAGGEDTTVAGGEDTTVAGGEDTTVAGGEDTTVAGGEDTTVAGGEDTTVAPGPELGSEENPIEVMFTMNDEYTEGTATVTVPAGATYYFQSYGIGGMNLTINDGTPTPLSGNPRMPVVFSITNEGEAEAEYALAVSYPVGSMSNPAQLVIGENTAAIEAGNTQGYYFTYTAEKNGVLTLTFSSNVAGWMYVVNNMTINAYGDTQWSDSDPVVNPAVITVAAGDEIQIIVNTYDPADEWNAPAGTITITAAIADHPAGYISGAMIAGSVALDKGYEAIRHGDGSVTITNTIGSGADEALNITPYALSTQYVVIKYKATVDAKIQILAITASGTGANNYYSLAPIGDGNWHTVIVDISAIETYIVGETVTLFRLDLCEAAEGQSITIDSIKFVDNIDDVAGVLAGNKWQMFVTDTLKADGVTASSNGTSQSAGPMQSAAVNGTVLEFDGTWVAVSGYSAFKGLSYTVVDSEGNVTTARLSIGNERTDVSTHVINNEGYDPATKGYALPNRINLSKWANETVTLSFNLILDDAGHYIVIYVATVNVGDEVKEPIPGYADGETIKSIVSNGYTTTLNNDGSITVTQSGGADGAINLQSLAAAGTPKYVLIKYKTTDTAEIVIYATTAGQSHKENYVTLKTDGAWHIIAVDLEAVGSYVAGDVISLFRFDFNEGAANAGKSVTFDFIRLVENPSEVELEPGEKIVYSIASKNNIDFLYADGNEATNLKSSSTIAATTVKYVGWLAVAKKDLAGISYVVTDANGETTTVAVDATKGADPVQAAVSNLGEGTVGYSVNFTADLSAWAGQTVSLSVVAEAVDGVVAETYSVVVNVPAAQ